jgi:hypothetical protein
VGTDQYVLEVCSQSPIFLNTVFDLADLNQYLLSLNLVRVWDARKNVSIIIQVSGAGELEFVQKAFFQERKQYLFKQETSSSGYYMANEPFLSNWSIIDFLNMSLPVNGSTSGIIS